MFLSLFLFGRTTLSCFRRMSQSNLYGITVLENDATSRVIGVDEILFAPVVDEVEHIAAESGDDDVPIATTLIPRHTTVSTVHDRPSRAKKTKRKKQTLWTYETVAEPTGIASKYRDEDAPSERATKRVAKQRLSDLHDAEVSEVTDAAVLETTDQRDLPTVVDNVPPNKISKTKSTKQTTTQPVVDELLVAGPPEKTTERTPIQRRCELQAFMHVRTTAERFICWRCCLSACCPTIVGCWTPKKDKRAYSETKSGLPKKTTERYPHTTRHLLPKLTRSFAVTITYSAGGNPSTCQP